MVLHTIWGGRVNRPFATALAAAWETRYGARPEIVHSADCVVIVYPSTIEVDDPFALVRVSELENLLRRAVERTGFFGARFREAAGRALLLPKAGPGKRVPALGQPATRQGTPRGGSRPRRLSPRPRSLAELSPGRVRTRRPASSPRRGRRRQGRAPPRADRNPITLHRPGRVETDQRTHVRGRCPDRHGGSPTGSRS